MDWMAAATKFVAGRPLASGGCGSPSPATARGVLAAIRACIRRLEGQDSLAGKTVAVQGAGSVGGHLVELLAAQGAHVLLADVSTERVKLLAEKFPANVTPCPADDILAVQCDVFAPCALGDILNATTIPQLRCRVVVGSANNPLHQPMEDADRLAARKILYAPDFVINAGGLIHIAGAWLGWSAEQTEQRIDGIGQTLRQIFRQAGSGNTHLEAFKLARSRLTGAPTAASERRCLLTSNN